MILLQDLRHFLKTDFPDLRDFPGCLSSAPDDFSETYDSFSQTRLGISPVEEKRIGLQGGVFVRRCVTEFSKISCPQLTYDFFGLV